MFISVMNLLKGGRTHLSIFLLPSNPNNRDNLHLLAVIMEFCCQLQYTVHMVYMDFIPSEEVVN